MRGSYAGNENQNSKLFNSLVVSEEMAKQKFQQSGMINDVLRSSLELSENQHKHTQGRNFNKSIDVQPEVFAARHDQGYQAQGRQDMTDRKADWAAQMPRFASQLNAKHGNSKEWRGMGIMTTTNSTIDSFKEKYYKERM